MKRFNQLRTNSHNQRSGTTLSEVLVSLLVMSIGVVSLATLFPISVLRSVQATQLTNAANLRYNVEALLSVRPSLYSIGTVWQGGYTYPAGALVIPSELVSLKSPAVVFIATAGGTSGKHEPQWDFTNGGTLTPPDGTITWQTVLLQNYVIDPLGEVLVEPAFRGGNGNPHFFGNNGSTPPTNPTVRAFSGIGFSPTESIADDVGTLPDSWLSQYETNSVAYTAGATSCILGGLQTDFSPPGLLAPGYPMSRVVLFDITGKLSYVRPVGSSGYNSALQQGTVDWSGIPSAGQLPLSFTPSSARVESKERRYTWMLSVRRGFSGTAYMDIVVFFRRPFSGKDEQLYPATFTQTTDFGADAAPGVAGVDDDGNGTTDFLGSGAPDPAEIGWPGSDDQPRSWVIIQYDDAGDKPFVKKGGFVTDADGLRWYRVTDYIEGDAINGYSPGALLSKAGFSTSGLNPYPYQTYVPDNLLAAFNTPKAIMLKLESPIADSTPSLQNLPPFALPPQGTPAGNAMLMRGIVDVYPIRTILAWEY